MKSTNTLASASSTAVPGFSQQRYDAECCQDTADKICQGADAAMEVMEILLEAFTLHYCLLPHLGLSK